MSINWCLFVFIRGYILKKQSQFVPARNDANSFLKGNYGNIPASGARKNKANLSLREQSQFIRSACCVLRSPMESLRTADSVKMRNGT